VHALSTDDGGGVPPVGEQFYYIVTGLNCRGESTPGFATGGVERILPFPCP
jgi:hypothetical protein